MNEYAPQHSRIFKEMIILSKPSKPFTYTAKGTARRQAVIRDYQEEIDELYEATGSSSQLSVEVELPVVWSYGNTLEFVREVVNSTLTKTVGDQDDIFHHGCDSLQATNIRNVLLRGLRDGAKVETLSLGKGNFVYTAPTISSLADLMMRTIDHKPLPPSVNSSLSSRVEKMMQMADHYSHFSPSEFVAALPLHLTQPRGKTAGRVVLLTGTTGALGSYILELLLKDKSVGRVYALNRRRRSSSATTILDRQKKVFQEKGLDVAILDAASDRLELLEGELSRPDFGLSKDVLGEVVSSVTTIIHNAWPVDFKFSLKSFEPMIKGLGNLISFSLASPLRPTVLFASTFAVLQNATPSPTPYQEVEIPPEYAVGTGYTESKWVAEELLCRASRDMGLRSLIVRVGQIAGGNNGTWKPEEWFPSLVMSSPDVGSFPDCDKLIGWIPLSTAAKAFTDFSRHPISGHRIAHLVHPRPITWNKVASTIARELGIPLSPFEDWLTTVRTLSESSSSKLEDNKLKHLPVLKLLTFMETSIAASLAEPNCDAMGIPFVDVSNALEFSSTLRDPKLASLDASDVRAWLRYWQNASKMPLTTARTQHGSHRRLFTSLWSSVLHFCTMLIGFSR
ncbi:hypothetical protein CC2G_001879 [Coprinopsis cinerea AmutBmut pab1-1]|nr:hypothetical protein CC2G_001879 [Coprinopsis cinerea AmutBmut pab1-1]